MLGGRAVATSSSELDSLAHCTKDAANLSDTTLPIASTLTGARSAREPASRTQPPPGGAHATRPSPSVNGRLPTAACSVSACAERADRQHATIKHETHNRR